MKEFISIQRVRNHWTLIFYVFTAAYHLAYPNHQFSSGRNLRTSPIHTQLEVAGAFFGETNAYERAMFFDPVHDGKLEMSQRMRFPTMWYVRPAKPQISLRICAV